jgi:3-oxo-5-alpha-steroid 4-dehydrogenase 1
MRRLVVISGISPDHLPTQFQIRSTGFKKTECSRQRRIHMFPDEFLHLYISLPWMILAVVVFIALFFVTAPYGRHAVLNSGPLINSEIAWLIMEAPSPLLFAACFLTGNPTLTLTQLVFLVLWESHYVDRAFIYPFAIRIDRKPFPVLIMLSGFFFNLINSYLNGSYIVTHGYYYQTEWLSDIRFILGVTMLILGFTVNRQSDYVLHRIRHSSTKDYAIPQHGLYRWVSCPNYLGEIFMWLGWALVTWSPVAAAFALWTIANLAPRAHAHHKWYLQHFSDYPQKRRALLPGLW